MPQVIALDGPSGSGKSTVARAVAAALGWRYVDTGATYRAATLAVLSAGTALDDPEAIAETVSKVEIGVSTAGPTVVLLDGADVSATVRGPQVTAAVSAVSAVPAVRHRMVALQRSLAGVDGAVLEGRDIGTAVFPDAPVKVFLDADPGVRAARRAGDTDAGVADASVQSVAADLARRDALDSGRAASPLSAAADAIHLDASTLTADEVVTEVLRLARAAGLT